MPPINTELHRKLLDFFFLFFFMSTILQRIISIVFDLLLVP